MENKLTQKELLDRYNEQVILTKISRGFLTDAYVDTLFTKALETIGEHMGIAQVLLYRLENESSQFVCRNQWQNQKLHLPSRLGNAVKISQPLFEIIGKRVAAGEKEIYFRSTDPVFEAEMKDTPQPFRNYIAAVLFCKGKVCAVLEFAWQDGKSKWNEHQIKFALMVAEVFSGAFDRDAMERQFSIIENSPNLVMSINTDMGVEYVNPVVDAATGYTRHELLTSGLGLIFSAETLIELRDNFIPVTMRGKTVQFEADVCGKTGEHVVLAITMFQTSKKTMGMSMKDLTNIRKLEKQSYFDALTGCYNRRYFDETLARALKSMVRMGGTLSLLLVDIDFFKKYNDNYGHAAGDSCLKIVADTLTSSMFRSDDFVARYGGEEFAVVLPYTDQEGAAIVAQRLLENVSNKAIAHAKSEIGHITVSIGGVTGTVQPGRTAEDFIKRADEMLYKSKQMGRNKYHHQEWAD